MTSAAQSTNVENIRPRAGLVRKAIATGAAIAAATAGTALLGPPAGAVIGGTATVGSDHPYFVRVIANGSLCGGSVIEASWVLTAAHCVDGGVTAGQVKLHISDKTTGVTATQIRVHPLWNGNVVDGHDLALVGVPASATTGVTPIQVGDPRDSGAYAANLPATALGRGRTSPNQPSSGGLRRLDTVLRSDDYMDDIYNPWYWFDNWDAALLIGAGSTTKTVCMGDSGGPLFVTRNGRTVQVGVASFTDTTGTPCDQPAGFAELRNAQLAWIGASVWRVTLGWGPCTTRYGETGRLAAVYDSTSAWFDNKEGRYYWGFECRPPSRQTSGSTTTTTPPPDDDTPPPCYPRCTDDF